MTDVSLGLRSAANARDLGGLPAADGRFVRRGVLYRANALNRLTDADLEAVGRLKLACLVDFRHEHEIEVAGPDRLPDPPPARVVTLSLFNPEHDLFTMVSKALRGEAGTTTAVPRRDNDGGGFAVAMLELYQWFISSTLASTAFGQALRLIAEPGELPLLFHCTAGKDRTGWLTAVVLSALGVDRSTIMEDYLRTNELNAAGTASVIARLSASMADPTDILALLEARREYLDEAFAEVDRRYGSMESYVHDGLGLDGRATSALRANLLTD